MRGLSLVAASGGHSSSQCAGLSLSRPLLLWGTGSRRAGSVIVAHGPQLLRGMWHLPRPGLEPVSPALAGRFSTTAPPGKPPTFHLKKTLFILSGIKKTGKEDLVLILIFPKLFYLLFLFTLSSLTPFPM